MKLKMDVKLNRELYFWTKTLSVINCALEISVGSKMFI